MSTRPSGSVYPHCMGKSTTRRFRLFASTGTVSVGKISPVLTVAAPIQLIDDAAKFARIVTISKEKTPAHVQSLLVQPCGGCFIIRALRLR